MAFSDHFCELTHNYLHAFRLHIIIMINHILKAHSYACLHIEIGMGNIENFGCNYYKAIITIIVSTLFLLKTDYKHVKKLLNVCANGKSFCVE